MLVQTVCKQMKAGGGGELTTFSCCGNALYLLGWHFSLSLSCLYFPLSHSVIPKLTVMGYAGDGEASWPPAHSYCAWGGGPPAGKQFSFSIS